MIKNYTTSEQHYGWANYETWRINLEVLDGMSIADFGYDLHELDTSDITGAENLGMAMEMYVCEFIESQASGFALDLALSFLARVDWVEIAGHFIDDARESN